MQRDPSRYPFITISRRISKSRVYVYGLNALRWADLGPGSGRFLSCSCVNGGKLQMAQQKIPTPDKTVKSFRTM